MGGPRLRLTLRVAKPIPPYPTPSDSYSQGDPPPCGASQRYRGHFRSIRGCGTDAGVGAAEERTT